jgi:hypothetical protein
MLFNQENIMYNDRNYLIFSVSELDKVNFNEVLESSADTVRKSVDGTKTFVKWEGERPASTLELTGAEGPYTHEEILAILSNEEWTLPMRPTEM